ncbi:hypothetical protein HDV01_002963 [Terramyces sp. JEL0728]|nr:hypothetical protein HDV01_002963 [Terramyces sp. JEL0728]
MQIQDLPLAIQHEIFYYSDSAVFKLACANKYYYDLLASFRRLLKYRNPELSWPYLNLLWEFNLDKYKEDYSQNGPLNVKFSVIDLTLSDYIQLQDILPRSNEIYLNMKYGSENRIPITKSTLLDLSRVTLFNVVDLDRDQMLSMQFNRFTRLKKLQMFGMKYDSYSSKDWKLLFKNLTTIPLETLKVSFPIQKHFSLLCAQLPKMNLKNLDLDYSDVDDNGLIKLANVLPDCSITNLKVSLNSMTDSGVISLSQVLHRTNLTHLDIHGNFTVAGYAVLVESLCDTKIIGFDAYGRTMKAKDYNVLFKYLPKTLVESTNLLRYRGDPSAEKELIRNMKGIKLKQLLVNLSAPNFEKFFLATMQTDVESLRIFPTRERKKSSMLANSHVTILAKHINNLKVKSFIMQGDTKDTYHDIALVFQNLGKNSIVEMELISFEFYAETMDVVVDCLPHTNLTKLSFNYCEIQAEDLKKLSKAVNATSLRYLGLSGNKDLTSKAIVEFAGSVKDSRLLDLVFEYIFDKEQARTTMSLIWDVLGFNPKLKIKLE